MKKIVCALLSLITLVGMLSIASGAAGALIFSDNFDEGFKPANWHLQEYKWDEYNQCVQGYQPARVLQSNFGGRDPKKWDQFYGKFDVQFRAFDDLTETDKVHTYRVWYRDLFDSEEAPGAVYYFGVEIETGRVFIQKEHTSFQYRDENNILQNGSIPTTVIAEGMLPYAEENIAKFGTALQVAENATWYEIGIRVTSGRIEGYIDRELVIYAEVDENDEKLGQFALHSVDSTVGSQKSPYIIFNGEQQAAMWLGLDNFEIWSADYDFAGTVYGDVNGDEKVNVADASLILKHVAKWEVELDTVAADANGDGKVNVADVSLVLKYIAKWSVVLGPTA